MKKIINFFSRWVLVWYPLALIVSFWLVPFVFSPFYVSYMQTQPSQLPDPFLAGYGSCFASFILLYLIKQLVSFVRFYFKKIKDGKIIHGCIVDQTADEPDRGYNPSLTVSPIQSQKTKYKSLVTFRKTEHLISDRETNKPVIASEDLEK